MTGTSYTVATAAKLRGVDPCTDCDGGPSSATKKPTAHTTKVLDEVNKRTDMGTNRRDDTSTPERCSKLPEQEHMQTRNEQAGNSPLHKAESDVFPIARKTSTGTEIYFSPIDVNKSSISLSSPMNSPSTTPTQASFTASQRSKESPNTSPSDMDADHSPLIRSEDVDLLLKALVDAPMIREHLAQASPSTISKKRTLAAEETEAPDLPIVPISPNALMREFDALFSHVLDTTKAPQSKFRGLRLMDSTTSDTRDGAEGRPTKFHLPEANPVHRQLQFSAAPSSGQSSRAVLQMVVEVISGVVADDGQFLRIDVDVTESFTKAALMELLQCSMQQEPADDMLPIGEAVRNMTGLHRETCTMQTLTLMSELDRVTRQFQDFYVVQAKRVEGRSRRACIEVPSVSKRLYNTTPKDSLESMMQLIVDIVGKNASCGAAFMTRVEVDGQKKRLCCLPVPQQFEHAIKTWICFAQDGSDV